MYSADVDCYDSELSSVTALNSLTIDCDSMWDEWHNAA